MFLALNFFLKKRGKRGLIKSEGLMDVKGEDGLDRGGAVVSLPAGFGLIG